MLTGPVFLDVVLEVRVCVRRLAPRAAGAPVALRLRFWVPELAGGARVVRGIGGAGAIALGRPACSVAITLLTGA